MQPKPALHVIRGASAHTWDQVAEGDEEVWQTSESMHICLPPQPEPAKASCFVFKISSCFVLNIASLEGVPGFVGLP